MLFNRDVNFNSVNCRQFSKLGAACFSMVSGLQYKFLRVPYDVYYIYICMYYIYIYTVTYLNPGSAYKGLHISRVGVLNAGVMGPST